MNKLALVIERTKLMMLRSLLMQLLNQVEDILGLPRSIPSQDERRLARDRQLEGERVR